jgi:hypothetical protein
LTRSEELGARAGELCLPRRIAFAGAVCERARRIFAICHGATPLATYDKALKAVWEGLRNNDLPAVASVYRRLTEAPESSCDDTLDRDWMAWLALATFEFPSQLVWTRVPAAVLGQCSGLMLTLTGEIDHRLGWSGPPREGRLATAEWVAQERCLGLLSADPSNPEVPFEELVAAGADVARTVDDLASLLADATGWNLHLPPG